MKKITFYFFLLFIAKLQAQVSIEPLFPTANKEITITIDVSKVKSSSATGLLGKTDDVYLWAWAGLTTDKSKADISPQGQSDFKMAFTPGKMTTISKNVWQIKFIPKDYYKTDKTIKWIGFLIKNGNGSSQSEDFVQDIFEDGLKVNFTEPSLENIVVDDNQKISIQAKASQKADFSFKFDGTEIASGKNEDSLKVNYTIPAGLKGKHEFTVDVSNANGKSSDNFSIYIAPKPLNKPYSQPLKPGVNYFSDGKVVFSFIAPQKKFVHLIGEFNNWKLEDAYLMNQNGNQFWFELNGVKANQETAYQYLVEAGLAVADPYAEKILDPKNDGSISAETFPNLKSYPTGAIGIVSTFEVGQKDFAWTVQNFVKPKQENLVIYELLVRDFTIKGNYKGVIDSLAYFKRLGINCIELMPIMEFTGNDSWGYNPTFYTAVDKAYGTKNDLKTLIDKCHQNGIAVVLDMVLNQADNEFPYVKMYWDGAAPSANSPYFNVSATHPYSVFFDFNHESMHTQELVKNVNDFWLKEFKFDGFRFDLSKGFTQKISGSNVGQWGVYDQTRIDIWKKINSNIKKTDPTAFVILEHFADQNEEADLAASGMMLWGNEHGGFENLLSGNSSSLYGLNYKNRQMATPNLVYYMESHDEERLPLKSTSGGLSAGNYSTKELKTFLERSKAAATLLMMSPGPKMIWQFGEFGYDVSINLNGRTGKKPLKWEYLADADRLKLMKVYGELGRNKPKMSFLNTNDFSFFEASNFKQWTFNGTEKAVVIANLNLTNLISKIEFPATGDYYDFFTGEKVVITEKSTSQLLLPGEFHIYSMNQYPVSEKNLVPWAAFKSGLLPLSNIEEKQSFEVYPNPSQDFITIKYANLSERLINVSIINQSGNTMQESTIAAKELAKGITINISRFPAGVYHVKVKGESVISKKIVKN
jgi:1,4-alpha-glucan branching enzyme